jgi:hypothetical protein
MNNTIRILYNAYVNTYALLAQWGFRPAKGHEMVEVAKFPALEAAWQNKSQSLWVVFENDENDDFIDVAFPGEVNKELGTMICQHVASGGSRGNAQRHTHVVLVISKLQPQAKPDLENLKKQPFTRLNYKLSNRVDIFTVVDMQLNPLLHSRQPSIIRLITDEDEKEEIRVRLLSAAENKDLPLADLMPIIYFNNPIAAWYDAYVNDLFYFVRQDGIPYFRIVKPDPQIDGIGNKTTKKKKPS